MSKFGIAFFLILSCLARAEEQTLKLPQKKISVCGENFTAWVSATDAQRQKGLMDFRVLHKSEAMLFIFEDEEPRNFWMKNVPYDLDIAFFNAHKILVSSMTMKGTSPLTLEDALPSYNSQGAAKFVVEVAGERFKKLPQTCKLSF